MAMDRLTQTLGVAFFFAAGSLFGAIIGYAVWPSPLSAVQPAAEVTSRRAGTIKESDRRSVQETIDVLKVAITQRERANLLKHRAAVARERLESSFAAIMLDEPEPAVEERWERRPVDLGREAVAPDDDQEDWGDVAVDDPFDLPGQIR